MQVLVKTRLLESLGLPFAFALSSKDQRVNPRDAYTTTYPIEDMGLSPIVIECLPTSVSALLSIDHHRPGDYGYDLGPEDYLQAASIGQLSTLLSIELTQEDKVLAAMDHCFSAALKGACPEVTVEEVLNRKINAIAESFEISPEKVMMHTFKQIGRIRDARTVQFFDCEIADIREIELGNGYTFDSLTLGVAQAVIGTPILYSTADSDGAEKIILLSDKPTAIEYFTQTFVPENELHHCYSVPDRGYAGAYF